MNDEKKKSAQTENSFAELLKMFAEMCSRAMKQTSQLWEETALEIWMRDGAPLPAGLFRALIKQLYRKNLLVKNKLKVGGETVDLSKIKCPVLNVVGTRDRVAAPESSRNVLELLGKPVKTCTRYVDLYENAGNEAFAETFLAFDYWANDQIPVAGETFRKFVKDTFQQNLLIENRMKMNGRAVDLGKIKSPLLNVVAEHDNIVPPAAAEALMDKIAGKDAEILKVQGGHHGITIGTSARTIVWKKTAEWMKDRQE